MRLEGWCDWRFYCPDEAYDFSRFPVKIYTFAFFEADAVEDTSLA
jgi:hypothetical protein